MSYPGIHPQTCPGKEQTAYVRITKRSPRTHHPVQAWTRVGWVCLECGWFRYAPEPKTKARRIPKKRRTQGEMEL